MAPLALKLQKSTICSERLLITAHYWKEKESQERCDSSGWGVIAIALIQTEGLRRSSLRGWSCFPTGKVCANQNYPRFLCKSITDKQRNGTNISLHLFISEQTFQTQQHKLGNHLGWRSQMRKQRGVGVLHQEVKSLFISKDVWEEEQRRWYRRVLSGKVRTKEVGKMVMIALKREISL